MKYLLLVVVLFIVWTGWKKRQQRREQAEQTERPPAERPVEQMVACAHCGVLMPLSDSLAGVAEPGRYCSEAHRRAGPRS